MSGFRYPHKDLPTLSGQKGGKGGGGSILPVEVMASHGGFPQFLGGEPYSWQFVNNGSRLIMCRGHMYQVELDTPYDLGSYNWTSEPQVIINRSDAGGLNEYFWDFHFNPDGTKIWITNDNYQGNEQTVSEFDLNTPFDLTTFTWVRNVDLPGSNGVYGFAIDEIGDWAIWSDENGYIKSYRMSTLFDITTFGSQHSAEEVVANKAAIVIPLDANGDNIGRFYANGRNNENHIRESHTSFPFTASSVGNNVQTQKICFHDGIGPPLFDNTGTKVWQYTQPMYSYQDIPTAWDISTIVDKLAFNNVLLDRPYRDIQGGRYVGNGKYLCLYVAKGYGRGVCLFEVNTPYSFEDGMTGKVFYGGMDRPEVTDDTLGAPDLKPDGTQMYVAHGDDFITFDLSEPFNPQTKTEVSRRTIGTNACRSLCWNDDGTHALTTNGSDITFWSCSTPYDILSGTSQGSLNAPGWDLQWNRDGTIVALHDDEFLVWLRFETPYDKDSLISIMDDLKFISDNYGRGLGMSPDFDRMTWVTRDGRQEWVAV